MCGISCYSHCSFIFLAQAIYCMHILYHVERYQLLCVFLISKESVMDLYSKVERNIDKPHNSDILPSGIFQ